MDGKKIFDKSAKVELRVAYLCAFLHFETLFKEVNYEKTIFTFARRDLFANVYDGLLGEQQSKREHNSKQHNTGRNHNVEGSNDRRYNLRHSSQL